MRESMTNFAAGDRDQHNDSSCLIHRIPRHADSIGIRLWRGPGRRSAARVLHSTGSRRAAGGAGVDYHRRHRCRSGLEAHPLAQHRLARIFHSLRHSTGTFASDEQSSEGGESHLGNHHSRVLDLFFSGSRAARTEARQSRMAPGMRILRGRARRRLWNERSAAGDLRSDAPMVGAALPRYAARIFSARQHHRHERLFFWPAFGLVPLHGIICSRYRLLCWACSWEGRSIIACAGTLFSSTFIFH